ncbi:hypothetical protein BDR26DRAFT_899431 [Obelidium mucronatum]|nr:hypothetical protein BDR26DRAFT_899431 [Obelidium mucronatum]
MSHRVLVPEDNIQIVKESHAAALNPIMWQLCLDGQNKKRRWSGIDVVMNVGWFQYKLRHQQRPGFRQDRMHPLFWRTETVSKLQQVKNSRIDSRLKHQLCLARAGASSDGETTHPSRRVPRIDSKSIPELSKLQQVKNSKIDLRHRGYVPEEGVALIWRPVASGLTHSNSLCFNKGPDAPALVEAQSRPLHSVADSSRRRKRRLVRHAVQTALRSARVLSEAPKRFPPCQPNERLFVVLKDDGATLSHARLTIDPVAFGAYRPFLDRLSSFGRKGKRANGMELICFWRKVQDCIAEPHYNASITKPGVSVKKAAAEGEYFTLGEHVAPALADCIRGLRPLTDDVRSACEVLMGNEAAECSRLVQDVDCPTPRGVLPMLYLPDSDTWINLASNEIALIPFQDTKHYVALYPPEEAAKLSPEEIEECWAQRTSFILTDNMRTTNAFVRENPTKYQKFAKVIGESVVWNTKHSVFFEKK